MRKKIIGILICMLLITTFLPVSSQAIIYINQLDDPIFQQIPGDLKRPLSDFEKIDTSQKKLVAPRLLSQHIDDSIITMIESMDEPLILRYLENLTDFGPRITGTTACQEAGGYIYDEFQDMGLEVRYHDWSYGGYSDRNIEATLEGTNETSDEIYIICAHYDSVPGSPGADDDGSGTVAVIAAAYIMSQYVFNHTIRFVTFSGEEQGLLGSHEYVEEAYNNGDNIVGVLNVDMIGFAITTDHGENVKVYYNDASVWLLEFTEDISEEYYDYINLNIIPSGFSWGSDHYSFWEVGYDAIFYHEYEFNHYYHSPQDIIENMNITYDLKCSKLILATLAELAKPGFLSNPPEAPTISGPTSGIAGIEYEYTFVSEDPDDDDIYYYVDWGDGTYNDWIGPYPSGVEAILKHTFTEKGTYTITSKAKDAYGVKSEISDPFTVDILTSIVEIDVIKGGFFRVKTVLKNIADVDINNVDWSIVLEGGSIFFGGISSGTITSIPPGGEVPISSRMILGFGETKVSVTVEIPECTDTREQDARVFMFYIKVNPGGSI